MSINSRDKGRRFEIEVAGILHENLGITFKRNLEQSRTADHGDLIADDPAFPFSIEAKRRAAGIGCDPAWIAQSQKAALAVGKIWCVVYRYDRQQTRVCIPWRAIAAATGSDAQCEERFETTLDGLCWLAREIMADRT